MVKIKPSYINSINRKIIYIRKFKTWLKYLIKSQKKRWDSKYVFMQVNFYSRNTS